MKVCLLLAALAATLCAQVPGVDPAKEPSPDTVVAKVDGRDVTLAELRGIIASAPPQFAQQFQQDPQAALMNYFTLKFLAVEGEKRKLGEQSPIKEQLELLRADMLAGAMVNQERDGYPVSVEQIDAYYQRNRSSYEQARIRVIFIGYKPSQAPAAAGTSAKALEEAAKQALQAAHPPNERSEAEARALAADIADKIRNGAGFDKMVEQYSDDASSKASHGDFGVVKHDSAYPEDLRKAVFALKQGQISDPVRQPTGFYIIRVEEITLTPIDEVRPAIVQSIRQDHLNEYLTGLNTRFRPVIQDPTIFLRPGAVGAAKP